MMRFLLGFVFIIVALHVQAQTPRHCGVEDVLDYAQAHYPDAYAAFLNTKTVAGVPRNQIVLPVVVHVVYSEEANNISYFQILTQIDALNEAFAGRILLSDDILPAHRNVIAQGTGIQFELACRDSLDQPTNGITRTKTTIPDIALYRAPNGKYAIHHSELGGIDPWPVHDYINIWVAEMGESLLGRATEPLPLEDKKEEGIVINVNNFGYGGEAYNHPPYHLGRTLVHEMGHYLGLLHIWGRGSGSCFTDDLIDDTPLQSEIYYGCEEEGLSSSCESQDMTKNIMGYADDECLLYFTKGQAQFMQQIVNTIRAQLLASNALANCGVQSNPEGELLLWNRIDYREWLVEFPTIQSYIDMKVYNMSGALVSDARLENAPLIRLSMRSFPAGMYIVQFRYNDRIEQRKINLF